MAVPGEAQWPSAGTFRGRPRGIFMAASGEFPVTVDTGSRTIGAPQCQTQDRVS